MPASSLATGARGDMLHLLVVIPCLDEAPTVRRVVADVPRDVPGIARVDVIVIDDGSTDGTGERAREAGAEVVRQGTTRGLGATFQEAVGIAIARGADVLLHIAGDGQFDPGAIPLLVKPVVDHEAHIVTASRFFDRDLVPTIPAVKRWGNWAVAGIIRLRTGRRFRDVSCGFRAFSLEALLRRGSEPAGPHAAAGRIRARAPLENPDGKVVGFDAWEGDELAGATGATGTTGVTGVSGYEIVTDSAAAVVLSDSPSLPFTVT